jgi:hypothetical protein
VWPGVVLSIAMSGPDSFIFDPTHGFAIVKKKCLVEYLIDTV